MHLYCGVWYIVCRQNYGKQYRIVTYSSHTKIYCDIYYVGYTEAKNRLHIALFFLKGSHVRLTQRSCWLLLLDLLSLSIVWHPKISTASIPIMPLVKLL